MRRLNGTITQLVRTGLLVGAMALLGSACLSSGPTPFPTLPTRPPVPDGWLEVAGGGMRIAAPAEWGPEFAGDPQQLLLSALPPPGKMDGVTLLAVGPRGEYQPEPPFTDERLADWMLKAYGGHELPDVSSRSIVLLPSGRAVLIRATYHRAASDGYALASYAIPTAAGVVFLQIDIDLDLMDRYGDAMDPIPRLLDLGGGNPTPSATP